MKKIKLNSSLLQLRKEKISELQAHTMKVVVGGIGLQTLHSYCSLCATDLCCTNGLLCQPEPDKGTGSIPTFC